MKRKTLTIGIYSNDTVLSQTELILTRMFLEYTDMHLPVHLHHNCTLRENYDLLKHTMHVCSVTSFVA